MRLIVGISGATGVIYGIRLLTVLREISNVQTHLVISPAARQTIALETDYQIADVQALADVVHPFKDIAASIASGSYRTDGMVIVPCTVKTLSGVALSLSTNLLLRAADVTLKERRRLVLVFRETPLHLGHLRLLQQATEMGAIVLPPMPAFYHLPKTLDDIIDQTVQRMLDMFDIEWSPSRSPRWHGPVKRGRRQQVSD